MLDLLLNGVAESLNVGIQHLVLFFQILGQAFATFVFGKLLNLLTMCLKFGTGTVVEALENYGLKINEVSVKLKSNYLPIQTETIRRPSTNFQCSQVSLGSSL